MNIIDKSIDYVQSIEIREAARSAIAEIKKQTERAMSIIRSYSKLDVVIMSAVSACAGAIFGCIFSKTARKLLAVLAAVCGLGTAYLIYKKYFKD